MTTRMTTHSPTDELENDNNKKEKNDDDGGEEKSLGIMKKDEDIILKSVR